MQPSMPGRAWNMLHKFVRQAIKVKGNEKIGVIGGFGSGGHGKCEVGKFVSSMQIYYYWPNKTTYNFKIYLLQGDFKREIAARVNEIFDILQFNKFR